MIHELGDPTEIILFEDFEEEWVENEDGDLVPDYDWKQEIYGETEGKWTREHYRDDVDLEGNVWIGRAPVESPREVSNFVYKTIKYEKTSSRDPYLKELLLIGGRMGKDKWGKSDCKSVAEQIPGEGNPPKYTGRTLLYDDPGIFGIPHHVPKLRLLIALHTKMKPKHLIYNMNHGYWWTIWRYMSEIKWDGKVHNLYRPFFHIGNALCLTNKKPFFWYSGSCFTGKFDEIEIETPVPILSSLGEKYLDCLAEVLTVKTKHGAFAAIMHSNKSISCDVYDKMSLTEWFYDYLFETSSYPQIGRAHQESRDLVRDTILKEKYQYTKERCEVYGRNLFGDPSVRIKIPTPNSGPNPLKSDDIIRYEGPNSDKSYTFKVQFKDPEDDDIQYRFIVNGIRYTRWTRYYPSGEEASKTFWLFKNNINKVKVQARDIYGEYWVPSGGGDDGEVIIPFYSNIQIDTSTVILGEEVQFSGQASGGNEPYTAWFYDFGDDNYGQQQSPSHTYNTIGEYTVTLNVNDSENISSNTSKVISVVLLNADFESSLGLYIVDPQDTFYFNDKSKGYYDIVNWSWDFGDGNISYNRNTSHTYSSYGAYNVSLTVTDNQSNNDTCYQMIYIDSVPPTISSVSSNFDIVGYGCNVTISVNTSDYLCGIKTVKVNITYPDSSYGNYTMNNTNGSIYEYVFSDCWQLGEYSYIVWVVDQADNCNCASAGSFVVSRIFGYNKIADSNQTIWDTITGSVFRVHEKCVADNISVYLDPGNASSDYHYTCVIYTHNNSVLVGVSEEKNISSGKGWQTFNFSVPKPVLLNDTDYVIGCWSDNNSVSMYYDDGDGIEEYYNDSNSTLQGHYFEGVYGYTPYLMDFDHEDRKYSIYCCYSPDNTSPEITDVLDTPDPVGFGFNVTITADVSDNQSGVDIVKVNITYPNSTLYSFTMDYVGNDTYKYVFNESWQKGQYSYLIWAVDYMNNSNTSSNYSFTVSGQAMVSVCTLKDEYGNNETVDLTDPPGGPPGIGYELLDNGDVLHIWNKHNNYYFDTESGIQLTNYYDEYWSHNVLMLGYYNNDVWNLIYRTDELSGFNKDIDCDNETFVNATLWKDLSYGGYDFRLAIRYHLGVDDPDLTVIPYIKNIDEKDIPYTLGFGWEIKDIRIANINNDNYLRIFNGTGWENVPLNQTLDRVFTGMDHNTTIRLICTNPPTYHLSRDLYLSWEESLNYKVTCKSRTGQYNAPVTLFIKVGTLNVGQEKYTHLHWLDSDSWLGITGNNRDSECGYDHSTVSFEVALNGTGMWAHGMRETHWGIIDLGQTYTIKKVRGRSNFMDDPVDVNIFVSANKTSWGTAVATNISTWQDTSSWVEVDSTDKDGRYVKIQIIDTEGLGGPQFLSFGDDMSPFKIFDVYVAGANQTPDIRDESPANGSTGVSISPVLGITVSDFERDKMNITWLSNSTDGQINGSGWHVFGTNRSVGDGTYYQTMANASVNGKWWYWNVSVTDGISTIVSDVFRFYTGYESKIVNNGSTDIKGYLLIQVQYYNTSNSTWVVADDTINETDPRTIYWESPGGTPGQHILALDTIFNGNVTTNYLINNFGTGTYRVYAAFRGPDGDVLVCDDQSLMEDSYQFTVSTS